MMQRFLINLGKRDGYIKKCITKDRMIRFAEFSATNAEKESLYELYKEIEKLIIQKLAILTSTEKSFVALLDEEKLKYMLEHIELKHHIIYLHYI